MNKRQKKQLNKINIDLSKTKFNTLEMILIFIMALVFGILIGEMVYGGNKSPVSLKTSTSTEMAEIKSVYNTILSEYINSVDKEELKEAAINGMMASLNDKHSMYFDEEQTEEFKEELNGYFTGLGVSVYKEGNNPVTIYEVLKNSPAEKYKLQKGDQFIKINGKDVKKATTEDISNIIRGKESVFNIVIKRKEEEKEIRVLTGKVDLESVSSKVIEKSNKKIGYVEISIFANNTDEQLKETLKKLEEENIDNLIIDLRYNPGGELETVINIASEFIDNKKPIIQIKTKSNTDIKYSKGNNNKKYNIAVLINDSSASGSEALAAALNEQCNAKLIGTTTYGKGTVQKTKQLPNGTIIKYTTETWSTSKGKSIEKVGIKPTIEQKQSKKYYETLKDQDDAQLQKALEELLK